MIGGARALMPKVEGDILAVSLRYLSDASSLEETYCKVECNKSNIVLVARTSHTGPLMMLSLENDLNFDSSYMNGSLRPEFIQGLLRYRHRAGKFENM